MRKQIVRELALAVSVVVLVVALVSTTSVQADFPVMQTVDSVGDVGYFPSLELDSSGYPRISYYDGTNADLKYAAWNGLSWDIETVDWEGSVGAHNSLALDSSGYPHISYCHDRSWWYSGGSVIHDRALKYAAWNSSTSSWDIETAEGDSTDVGTYSSLALDSSDRPHIAYYRYWPYGNDLLYTHRVDSSWSGQMVDNGFNGIVGPSLALDSSDYPHISYHDWDDHRLRYAVSNGSSWSSTLLDTYTWVSGTSYDTSLALDSSGHPHISYFGGTTPHLKYALWDGSSWDITTVDDATTAHMCTELALDGSGSPHIVYYDDTNQDVKYAAGSWNGSSWNWTIETVDSVGGTGYDIGLAVDSRGFAHISYYDATNGDLKYANNTPELPPSALLGLSMLPWGIAYLRGRRRKQS